MQLLGVATGSASWRRFTKFGVVAKLSKIDNNNSSSSKRKSAARVSSPPPPRLKRDDKQKQNDTSKKEVEVEEEEEEEEEEQEEEEEEDVHEVHVRIKESAWDRAFNDCSAGIVSFANPLSIGRLLSFRQDDNSEKGGSNGGDEIYSTVPQPHGQEVPPTTEEGGRMTLFAVAGGMLEIKGGRTRASMVTLIPPIGRFGWDWMLTALWCSGGSCFSLLEKDASEWSSLDEDRLELCHSIGARVRSCVDVKRDEILREEVLRAFANSV
jgi:hypothetical protein